MFDKQAIRRRAWEIFCTTYNFPAVPFAAIGTPAVMWALRAAWVEARRAARVAAIPADVKAARVRELQKHMELLAYRSDYRQAQRIKDEIAVELRALAAH